MHMQSRAFRGGIDGENDASSVVARVHRTSQIDASRGRTPQTHSGELNTKIGRIHD
jgi:hypothetical protein